MSMSYIEEAQQFIAMLQVSMGRNIIARGMEKDVVKAMARWKSTSFALTGPAVGMAEELVSLMFYSEGNTGDTPLIHRSQIVAALTKQIEEKNEMREEMIKASHRVPLVTAVLFTNDSNQVLLGRRKNNSGEGFFSTPGGLVEQHEDVYACAEREVIEETGYEKVSRAALQVIAWREHHRFGKHYIVCYLHHQYNEGLIYNKEPYKCEGWEWKSFTDLNSSNCMEPQDVLAILHQPVPSPKEFWQLWAPGNLHRASKSNKALATAFTSDYLEMWTQAHYIITSLKEPIQP
jgi:8-oxo-dGTP diphosphatase